MSKNLFNPSALTPTRRKELNSRYMNNFKAGLFKKGHELVALAVKPVELMTKQEKNS